MIRFSSIDRSAQSAVRFSGRTVPFFSLLSVPFLAGIVFGVLIGLYADAPQTILFSVGIGGIDFSGVSFLTVLWRCARFPLFAALLSTGILGVVLLPLLSGLRGFVFACSVAATVCPFSFPSLIAAFLTLAVPALFGFPAFFLFAADGFLFSRQLLLRDHSPDFRDLPLLRHMLFAVVLCFCDAIYCFFLLPELLAILT